MKQKLKKISLFFLTTIILFIVIIASNTNILRPINYETIYNSEGTNISEILDGTTVTQSFVCNSDNLSKFDLVFQTYDRENTCKINVELFNKTQEKRVETWQLSGAEIPDNQFLTFTLTDAEKNVKGNEYEIIIFSKGAINGNAITLYTTANDEYVNGECQINGVSIEKDLCFSVTYSGDISLFDIHSLANMVNIYFIVTVMLFIVLFVIDKMIKGFNKRKDIIDGLKQHKKDIKLFIVFIIVDVIGAALLEMILSFVVEGTVNTLGYYFNWYRWIYIICALLVVEELYFYIKKKINKVEHLFLAVMITVGGLLITTQPIVAAVNWDGQIHYERTEAMAYLTEYVYTKADNDMSYIRYDFSDNMSTLKENYESSADYINRVLMKKAKQYTISYTSLAYIPTAMLYRAGKIIHAPFWLTFSLGRLANFILYTYLIYQAIKKIKWGKMICAVIGLFPTALFLASNYGYDHWVTGFSMLGMAYLIGEMQDSEKKMSWKSVAIIFGSFFFGFSAKAIYFPIVVLCFMMKKEKFSSNKMCYIFKGCSLVISLLIAGSFAIPFLVAGPGTGDARGGSEVNSTEQVRFIFTQPWEYTKILLRFLFVEYLNPVCSGEYTNAMAYLGKGSFGILSFIAMILSVVTGRNKEEKDILTVKNRIWTIFLVFGTVCLVVTALYISFTPVGYYTVNGCQYRYFIPLLFPLLYFANYDKISNWFKERISIRKMNVIIVSLSILAMFLTYYQVWIGNLY